MRPWAGIVCVALALLPVPRAAAQPCVTVTISLPAYTYPPPSTYRFYLAAQISSARRPAELVPSPRLSPVPEGVPPPKPVPGTVRVPVPAHRSPPERVPVPRP